MPVVLAAGLGLGLPAAAGAAWTATADGSANAYAATVANASSLTAACGSKARGNFPVVLNWTASPTGFVEGYVIDRTGSGGGTSTTVSVSGRTSETYTDNPPNTDGSTYTYAIRATGSGWSSGTLTSSVSVTFTRTGCTAG